MRLKAVARPKWEQKAENGAAIGKNGIRSRIQTLFLRNTRVWVCVGGHFSTACYVNSVNPNQAAKLA